MDGVAESHNCTPPTHTTAAPTSPLPCVPSPCPKVVRPQHIQAHVLVVAVGQRLQLLHKLSRSTPPNNLVNLVAGHTVAHSHNRMIKHLPL